MKKILVSLVAMMFLFAPMAFATTIANVNDAWVTDADSITKNADFAYGYTDSLENSNMNAEANFINDFGYNFYGVAKYDSTKNTQDFNLNNQWTLTVSKTDDIDSFEAFDFTLKTTGELAGQVVDFALGVKQAKGFAAYVFNSVRLDLDGYFKSTFVNNGNQTGGYSHVSAFVQTTPVPEPATLLLFGAGIAGLALSRRKRS